MYCQSKASKNRSSRKSMFQNKYEALTSTYHTLDNTKKRNVIFNDLRTVEAKLVKIVPVENLCFKIK